MVDFSRAVHPQGAYVQPQLSLLHLESAGVDHGAPAAAMPPRISDKLQTGATVCHTAHNAIAPAGATPEGLERALYLCRLKLQRKGNKPDPDLNHPCLQTLLDVDGDSPQYELYKQRRIPKQLRTQAAQQGVPDDARTGKRGPPCSFPSAWQVPHDELPNAGSKRGSPEAQGGAEVEEGFNLSDKNM